MTNTHAYRQVAQWRRLNALGRVVGVGFILVGLIVAITGGDWLIRSVGIVVAILGLLLVLAKPSGIKKTDMQDAADSRNEDV